MRSEAQGRDGLCGLTLSGFIRFWKIGGHSDMAISWLLASLSSPDWSGPGHLSFIINKIINFVVTLGQSLPPFRPQCSLSSASLGAESLGESVLSTLRLGFPVRRLRLGRPSVGRAPPCLASPVVTTAS